MQTTFRTQAEKAGYKGSIPAYRRNSLTYLSYTKILIAALALMMTFFTSTYAQHHHGEDHTVETHAMDEMVVTADRIAEYVENHPRQVEILDRQEITQRNMLSVEEALRSMPGVDVKKSSGGGSRISIRGSGKSGGVLVLLNGRPFNNTQYGAADLSSIPIEIIQSITVFKPPIPVWLGPGGSDGAINIITHTSAGENDKKRHITQLRGAGGSYGFYEGSVSQRSHLKSGNFMATASGSHRDGKRTNSDKNNGTFSMHWDRKSAGRTQVEVDGSYYLSKHGSTGPEDNPTPDARQEYQKSAIDGRISSIISPWKDYAVNLYMDDIKLKDESQSGASSTLDNLKWGLRGEYNWSDKENLWACRINGTMEDDNLDHTLSGNHHRLTTGLGAQVDRRFKRITGTFGLRGDYTNDYHMAPGINSGISYHLAKHWLAKANAGHSVNLPSFGQLYQPSHGSIDQTHGNPDLSEEFIWSYDLGLEYRSDKTHLFQATLFRTDTQDPIVYQRGNDLIYRPVNENRSFRHGAEFSIKYGFENGMTIDLDTIFQTSEISSNDKELPYTPQIKVKGSLLYAITSLATRLESSFQYASKQFTEMENKASQQLDDYFTIDIKATQPFKIRKIPAEWFISIENLLDTDYEIHYGYPDDGVRFISGLNLTL